MEGTITSQQVQKPFQATMSIQTSLGYSFQSPLIEIQNSQRKENTLTKSKIKLAWV